MKNLRLLLTLAIVILFIISCNKDQASLSQPEQINQSRSGTVSSVTDIQHWFEQYLINKIGSENAAEGLTLFNIEWNNYIEWDENSFVFPMYHFVSYGRVGYTRLFVDLSDSEPEAYFYSVFPDNQSQINFDHNDVINFNGELFTFDITDGYQDIIEYENGELVRLYDEDELIVSRCISCWPDWWAPRVVDGGTVGNNWPWDDSWIGDGSADTGGGEIDCFAPCPNGYPKPHPNRAGVWLNCNHQRDCDGVDFDIDIINIPGGKIHKKGSKTTKGGGGSSINDPLNGNPKNPIDEAGLDEIKFQQLVNDVCHYLQLNNITDKDCEDIALIVNANCRQEDGDLLEDCIEDALDNAEEDDKSCINDYGFTRKEKQLLINLDCGFLECLSGNKEVKDEVLGFLELDLLDPCDQNKLAADIVNDVLSSMTNEGSCDLSKLKSAFSSVDKIINNLTDPRLKCIYKELTLDSDKIFCNSYENFLGSSSIDLNLQNSEQVVGYAQTTYYDENSPYGHIVDVAFNQNQMEEHCEITIVGAFLHEGIHAEMFRQLNDPNLNPDDFASVWSEYDNNISDHENMAQTYIDNLISSLEKRFGNKYTYEEYEAIAWHGLGDINGEGVNTSAWNSLSEAKKANLKNTFININSDCSNDVCK